MVDFKNPLHQMDYEGYLISVYVVWGQDTTFYGEIADVSTGLTCWTPRIYNSAEKTIIASRSLVYSVLRGST